MSLKRLLDEGKIEKIEISSRLIRNALSLAERDIKAAKDNLNSQNYDWALSIAYNAMLQASRALMFSQGYRPKSEGGHVSAIEFVKLKFEQFKDEIPKLDRLRRKRHLVLYEQSEVVSEEEAKKAIDSAEKFVEKVKKCVKQ